MRMRAIIIGLIVIIASIVAGCGEDPKPKSVSELKRLFEQEAASYSIDFDLADFEINIVRSFDKDGVVGRCWYRGRGYMRGFKMEMLRSFWSDADAEERELLFFHEGGHCFLGQNHRSNSIMEPSLFGGYFDDRDKYLDEMFLYGYDSTLPLIEPDDKIRYIDIQSTGTCSDH